MAEFAAKEVGSIATRRGFGLILVKGIRGKRQDDEKSCNNAVVFENA
jgi:hypothetical protein